MKEITGFLFLLLAVSDCTVTHKRIQDSGCMTADAVRSAFLRQANQAAVSVYQANTGENLSSVVLSGMSKWARFGGVHPQDHWQDNLLIMQKPVLMCFRSSGSLVHAA